MIKKLEKEGSIPKIPVYLDSPMANAATRIFLKHTEDQKVASGFNDQGEKPFSPEFFEQIRSVDDSMLACMKSGPGIVISASGLLAGGRVLHHVKHRIEYEKNTILFVGYQAKGTKGRFLQEARENGELEIRIHH